MGFFLYKWPQKLTVPYSTLRASVFRFLETNGTVVQARYHFLSLSDLTKIIKEYDKKGNDAPDKSMIFSFLNEHQIFSLSILWKQDSSSDFKDKPDTIGSNWQQASALRKRDSWSWGKLASSMTWTGWP